MRSITVLLVCGGLLLSGCGSEDGRETKKSAPRVKDAAVHAAAEVRIEHLRKQKTPDWAAITAAYEKTAKLVKEIDRLEKTRYAAEIREALRKCAKGERPKVHQQTVAKGLQHVTVLAIRRELGRMAGAKKSSGQAAVIAVYFEGIRPTFSRRDRDYFGGRSTLEAAAEKALARLGKAGTSGGAELLAAQRELKDIIARTYALCVLFEVQEIAKLRDKDRDKCDVKRAEAVIFYRIISSRVKQKAPKAHATISAMLAGGYEAMDPRGLEAQLKKGLPGLPLR